jgi:hypothetical protein
MPNFDVDSIAGLFPHLSRASLEAVFGTYADHVRLARAATTGNLVATRTGNTLLADAVGALGTQDGITMVVGNRLLIKEQTADADNGIYEIDSLGGAAAQWSMHRADDFDTSDEVVAGIWVMISEGTTLGNETWVLTTNDPITLNTTSLTFTQLPSLADLAATTAGHGAALIGIQDAAANLTNTTVELAIGELAEGGGVHQIPMRTVRGASTGNTGLTSATNPHDGVTYVDGERILLKDQTTGSQDGIYVWSGVGVTDTLSRDNDWNADMDVKTGLLVSVSEGTANADTIWRVTANAPYVVGTTDPAFAEVWTAARGLAPAGAPAATITDAGSIITATTLEGACQEFATDINTACPGMPMMNRLRMLGAPGAIVATNTVTIGGDIYEFNANTPPSGGTAGSIWVYQGADSAASRTNFINAVNNVTDAPNITYDGAVTESMYALAGVTTGDVVILSATAIGSTTAAPSTTATATTETLATAEDIWDETTMYGGKAEVATQIGRATIIVDAAHIAKGNLQAYFDFTPTTALVKNRMRPQDEAWVITGNAVSLTLAGAAAPNNQANDVIDIIAIA